MTIKFKKVWMITLLFLSLFPLWSSAQTVTIPVVNTPGCSTVTFTVCVQDTDDSYVYGLEFDDFDFEENGDSIDHLVQLLKTCPDSAETLGGIIDIVIFIDKSYSMNDDKVLLEANLPRFVDSLEGMDYRVAMIEFNGCPEGSLCYEIFGFRICAGGVDAVMRTDFSLVPGCTYDSFGTDIWATTLDEFQCIFDASIDSRERDLVEHGNGVEDQFGALCYGIETLGPTFRPEAEVYFILFTDESPKTTPIPPPPPETSGRCQPELGDSDEDLDAIVDTLNNHGIHCLAVTPPPGHFPLDTVAGTDPIYDGYVELGPRTDGAWFNLDAGAFTALVDTITYFIIRNGGGARCCYDFRYKSTNICTDTNTLAAVEVRDEGRDMGSASVKYSAHCPPSIDSLLPNPPGGISSCARQNVEVFFHENEYDVDESSLVANVNGTDYYFTDDEMSWDEMENKLIFEPLTDWEHLDTVYFKFVSGADDSGCAVEPDSTWFILDLRPPEINSETPTNGAELNIPNPEISVVISDTPAGVDPVCIHEGFITVYVNGSPVSGFTIDWDGETLNVEGLTFSDGDSVRVCLDSIWDSPDYNYCSPNDTSFCWRFDLRLGVPMVQFIYPDTPYVACTDTDQHIRFRITDANGVDTSTVCFEVNGDTFSLSDDELELISCDSIYVFRPSITWADAETIQACLIEVENSFGNGLDTMVCWDFIMDLKPPTPYNISPPDESIFPEGTDFDFEVWFYDSGSGIYDSSIKVYICDDTFDLSHASITLDTLGEENGRVRGIHFIFDPGATTITWRPCSTICVTAVDRPDECGPNDTIFCWGYYFGEGVIGIRELPAPDIYTACFDQKVIIRLESEEEIIDSTIRLVINEDTLDINSSPYLFLNDNDSLIFAPDSGFWEDGETVYVELIRVEDVLGDTLSNEVAWSFYTDFSPPTFSLVQPPVFLIADTSPVIRIDIDDRYSGLDPSSVNLTIDGNRISSTNITINCNVGSNRDCYLALNCEAAGLYFTPGDSVEVMIEAEDRPEEGYCSPNHGDSVFYFMIELIVDCNMHPQPFSPNADGINEYGKFEYPDMDEDQGVAYIYDMDNKLVRELRNGDDFDSDEGAIYWNGKDEEGKVVDNGIYLYLVKVKGKIVCKGTLYIAK